MDIHVVRPGDTLFRLAWQYGVPMSRILQDNRLPNPNRLAVGQALVIQYPKSTWTVRSGDTLSSISRETGVSVRQLWRNNPELGGDDRILPGQELTLSFQQKRQGTLSVNGYAYPSISLTLLRESLPYLSTLTPFTYRFTPAGELIPPADGTLIASAREMGAAPILHLAAITETGAFSGELVHAVLSDGGTQNRLTAEALDTLRQKGYRGLDVDFEGVFASDAERYAQFVTGLREGAAPLSAPVAAALAPKLSAGQRGVLYEGHDYSLLGKAADFVLLMTYEWGYTYGPPMAVAPLQNVRAVVEYALTEIPAEKIWLGIPTYGYDWTIPYQSGVRARSLSSPEAVALAVGHNAAIRYDSTAQTPWFRYSDDRGQEHEVWFEDARSIRAKLELAREYTLYGVGYWNLMRPFPQNWAVLNSLFEIRN